MDLKAESLRFKRVDGLSYSTTVPSLKTAIKSESKIVFSRWAIVMTVQSLNSERIVFWIRSSVSISIAAVASSKIRIFVFRSKALDKQISCRWPTEKLEPDSVTSWSKPFSRLWTWAFKWACSSAEINAILIIFFQPEMYSMIYLSIRRHRPRYLSDPNWNVIFLDDSRSWSRFKSPKWNEVKITCKKDRILRNNR